MISGTEAAEIGLADYVVEQNETGDAAYQRALTMAEEILPRGPVAVRMAKLAINKGIQVSPLRCTADLGKEPGTLPLLNQPTELPTNHSLVPSYFPSLFCSLVDRSFARLLSCSFVRSFVQIS